MESRIEPMLWNGHAWWTIASTRTEMPADAFAAGWRYHGPCDPDAVILNPDDIAARVLSEVLEMSDRTSPEDWPEALLVTGEELTAIVKDVLQEATRNIPADVERNNLRTTLRDTIRDFDRAVNALAGMFTGLIGEARKGLGDE